MTPAAGHCTGMSSINAQAEQARESARKADGKFGSYSSGESGATLSGPEATSQQIPTLSPDQQRKLEAFAEERVSWHEDTAAAYRESKAEMEDDNGYPDQRDTDTWIGDAEGANFHEVAAAAHKLPVNATIAEYDTGATHGDRITAWFDRDGNRHEADIPLEQELPGEIETPFSIDPEGGRDDKTYLDVEQARQWSDRWAVEEAEDITGWDQMAEDVPNTSTSEIRGLRKRATMRELLPDVDDALPGDEIKVWADGAAVNSGVVSNRVPADFDGMSTLRIAHEPDMESGQDFTDISFEDMGRNGVTVYTDRQREIEA